MCNGTFVNNSCISFIFKEKISTRPVEMPVPQVNNEITKETGGKFSTY